MSKDEASGKGRERRKYFRLNRECVVQCERYTIPRQPEATSSGKSLNLSSGGILFESKAKFELGDMLRLEVKADGWEKFSAEFYKHDKMSQVRPLFVLGTVVRSELLSGGAYEIGVAFTGIDDGHRWALEKYLKAHGTKENTK